MSILNEHRKKHNDMAISKNVLVKLVRVTIRQKLIDVFITSLYYLPNRTKINCSNKY